MKNFLHSLKQHPELIDFNDTMAVIEKYYNFEPSTFINGDVSNKAGENNGSCKLFAFAKLQGLNEQQTLNCFGQYYQHDVLQNPDGIDHQNIRNFMQTGWAGLNIDSQPLTLK